jgi:Uma2 family endonuclease
MGVMTIAEAWPAAGQPFTVAELDRMPDDGRRYELVGGALVVGPRPTLRHQEVADELLMLLRQRCPADLRAISEPAVQLSAKTEFDPDIVVIKRSELTAAKVTQPPLLVVEVRSPGTALIDLNVKKAAYERFGVQSYWIVVPDVGQPELIAFDLCDGCYERVAHVRGSQPFRAQLPFPVEVVPARLVAGLLPT